MFKNSLSAEQPAHAGQLDYFNISLYLIVGSCLADLVGANAGKRTVQNQPGRQTTTAG